MRNVFALIAIALSGILFTAAFSLVGGAMQMAQENTMREVGGTFHAGIKAATMEQYEKTAADPLVKKSSFTIFIGIADNILDRQAEIRYTPEESTLPDLFITLEEGHLPREEREILVDTFTLEELGLPCALGEKVPLTFSFMGETVEEEFTLSGWYEGDHVAHASELFVSESYWLKLKGSLTDEDFVKWGETHPEDEGTGLTAGNFFFDNASGLEEKIRTVIQNAGYEPGTELSYGVNWAYMSSRMESVDPFTFLILASAVLVILLTGYLIIYNIFQISVISDIRFYGLLKTIGTTKGQIRCLVRRQAVRLSLIGIPVGLLIGYGVGKLALPFALSISDYQGMEIALRFDPWILVWGGGFTAFTVFLSSRKPGKIAGNVSPIEALRYTEADGKRKKGRGRKKKKHAARFSAVSMAWASLGRNRRTTAVVIAAISFSIILLAVIMTAVGSFQIDQFMEQRIAGDFLIGNRNVTSTSHRSGDIDMEPEYLALADRQAGIQSRTEMWVRFQSFLQINDQAAEQLRKLDEEGKLNRSPYAVDVLEERLAGERSFNGFFYGYGDALLSNLKVLEGTLDVERFQTGNYVLLGQFLGDGHLPSGDHVYHPGDRVTVEYYTEDSTFREVRDESGATVDMIYENLGEKEYEVMAVVEIPDSMNLRRYSANSCDVVLPLAELEPEDANVHRFAVSYQVEEEAQEAFEAAVKAYTDEHTTMGYTTKESLRREFANMVTVIATIGISLAAVIALIGILNFVNAMITGILSRRREFAMLQSIGMTSTQLVKTLICEGISYIALSGVIGFLAGSLLSFLVLRALNNVLLFFEYHFQILPFVIMMPVFLVTAVLAPVAAYRNVRKKSIVERLRESEQA
jgi:putative ABC transport system permease protein